MPHPYSQEEEQRLQSYLKVHLKDGEATLPADEQIPILQKKNNNKWWLLLFNAVAILFFGYSFLYGITQLSNTLFYILLAVFIVNVFLIIYQKRQLSELVEYLKWKNNYDAA